MEELGREATLSFILNFYLVDNQYFHCSPKLIFASQFLFCPLSIHYNLSYYTGLV